MIFVLRSCFSFCQFDFSIFDNTTKPRPSRGKRSKKYPAIKPSYESTSIPRLYFGKFARNLGRDGHAICFPTSCSICRYNSNSLFEKFRTQDLKFTFSLLFAIHFLWCKSKNLVWNVVFFVCVAAGTNTHSVDFRKSAGGFIHGFRYTGKFDLNLAESSIYLDIGIC